MSMSDEYLRGWLDARRQVFDALEDQWADLDCVETAEFWRGMFRAETLVTKLEPAQ